VSEPEAHEFRLLPGEALSSPSLDAQHWVRVYAELVDFCELMLARSELSLEDAHLHRRLNHYRFRLQHWRAELVGGSPDCRNASGAGPGC
jgi:hypothetical protein